MDTENNGRTLTVSTLRRVIKDAIGEHGMEEVEAEEMARHVMNLFGFNNRILDNMLEPQDRDVFYMLEDEEILTTEREETTLYDGREWRIHYWIFRREKITEILNGNRKEIPAPVDEFASMEEDESSIYDEIPDDIWSRRGDEEEE